jgi:hypothetical protein
MILYQKINDISNVWQQICTSIFPQSLNTQIVQMTARNIQGSVDDSFILDTTLGRDVKFTLDNMPGKGSVKKIEIFFPNGTKL